MEKLTWNCIFPIMAACICLMFIQGCGDNGGDNGPVNQLPVLTTTEAKNIDLTTATCGGNITSDGGTSVTERGVCWSESDNPTVNHPKAVSGAGVGTYTAAMKNLKANTLYYVRAYAINGVGTAYGNTVTFTTHGTVTDIDGNTYHTLTFHQQVWMIENLRVTKYRNGNAITNVTDKTAWNGMTSGAYCDYSNVAANSTTYGRLYNWYAVNDTRKICPTGWHVASNGDWKTMTNYFGDDSLAGGILKETGLIHWKTPNTGAINDFGFTALPGGIRFEGTFSELGTGGYWWTATLKSTPDETSYTRNLNYKNIRCTDSNYVWTTGMSVRCMKD